MITIQKHVSLRIVLAVTQLTAITKSSITHVAGHRPARMVMFSGKKYEFSLLTMYPAWVLKSEQ